MCSVLQQEQGCDVLCTDAQHAQHCVLTYCILCTDVPTLATMCTDESVLCSGVRHIPSLHSHSASVLVLYPHTKGCKLLMHSSLCAAAVQVFSRVSMEGRG